MMPRRPDRSAGAPPDAALVATLFGCEHTEPASSATAVAGRLAVGIARGWRPKPYAYVDPNEDAVAAVDAPHGQLLVVADGHNGHEASHVAVRSVLDVFADRLRPDRLHPTALREAANDVARRVAAVSVGQPRSRTTLIAALRTAGQVHWFSAGDSALLVVDGDAGRQLSVPVRWFFGDDLAVGAGRRGIRHGRAAVGPAAWVIAVTDGYTDYLPRRLPPAEMAALAVHGTADPRRAVGALLDQARRGGAGDNVGVSVSPPW